MFISNQEKKKLFIECFKKYIKYFVFLGMLTVFGYVVFMCVPRNEIGHALALLLVVLYLITINYPFCLHNKVEDIYKEKPEKEYAYFYNYVIYFFCIACCFASLGWLYSLLSS